jgi:hypothetical protein
LSAPHADVTDRNVHIDSLTFDLPIELPVVTSMVMEQLCSHGSLIAPLLEGLIGNPISLTLKQRIDVGS